MSIRAEKAASVVKRILAEPVSHLAKEHEAGLATVTAVRLSPDLHIAKVYVSVYGGKLSSKDFITLLDDNKGHLRSAIGAGVRLRYTPELRFYLDDTLDKMEYIQNLLNTAKENQIPLNLPDTEQL
jgi:ribosome-binding factor A